MLIATGHVDEARVVWNQALQAAAVPRESESSGSLVWNGGFENEPLDGGFDWRFLPVEGAEMRWDEEYPHSGTAIAAGGFRWQDECGFRERVAVCAGIAFYKVPLQRILPDGRS